MYKTVKAATFTLPLEILEDLDNLSDELGMKKTAIVTEALEMYMDLQDLKLAKYRASEDDSISEDDFFADLSESGDKPSIGRG